jgi:acyl carrier protein
VTKVLVDALGLEEDQIRPASTLKGDLGAESIDFLDITFRLEREFGIKIPSGELFPDQGSRDDSVVTPDGRLTDRGLAALQSKMPFADLASLVRDHRLGRVEDLFTAGLLVNYIQWKLGLSSDAAGVGRDPVPATPSLVLR